MTERAEMDHCNEHSAHVRAIGQHDARLNAHGAQLDALNETLAALRVIETQNQEMLERHDVRLAALEAGPAKRWEMIINYLMTAILGIVVGIVAGHLHIL